MRQAGFAHIILIILLLAGLAVGVYLVQQKQIFKGRASELSTQAKEIDDLTNQLIQKRGELKQKSTLSQADSDSITAIAIKRKDALLKEIEQDPQSFLDHAKLADQKSEFPKQVQQYLEQKVEKRGKLLKVHYDDIDYVKSQTKYFLSGQPGSNRVILFFVNSGRDLLSADQINVKGVELNEHVAVENATVVSPARSTQAVPVTEAKVAVILFKFNNTPEEQITKSQADSLVFSGDTAVKKYYQETSFNKMKFNGGSSDVFGWYQVSFNNDHPCIYDNQWLDEVNQQVQASGVNLMNYTHKVYIFTKNTQCSSWGGWAHIGGDVSMINGQFSPSTIAHELGHNFGLDHASSFNCHEKTLDIYSNCTLSEYGDPYDVMGIRYHHFNSPHKFLLGWLDSSNIQTITQDGTYTVNALEYASGNIKTLKINKKDTKDYYYIEYRQPHGFDSDISTNASNGVQIRIWNEAIPNDLSANFPRILDNHPITEGIFSDSSLADGETFYDSFNNISIKQISHNTDSNLANATVEISFNPQVSPTPSPTPAFSPIGGWQKTLDLPQALKWHAAAANSNYIFVLGGGRVTTTQVVSHLSSVYSGKIGSSGEIVSWTELTETPLPKGLSGSSALIYNNHLYVLGGADTDFNSQSSIYRATINSDGTLSPWTELTETPLPKRLQYFPSVIYNGVMYIIGGYSQFNYEDSRENKVYSAKINTDGTLQPWRSLTDFPIRIFNEVAVAENGYLAVIGGRDYNRDLDTVYTAQVLTNGDLGSWTELKSKKYPQQRNNLKGVSQNGIMIIIGGGWYRSWDGNEFPVAEVYSTKILSDGRIDPWFALTPLPEARFHHTVTMANNRVYVIGGEGSGLTANTVYFASLVPNLVLPSPTPIPFVCTPCSADINKDGNINLTDFNRLKLCLNKQPTATVSGGLSCSSADINGDGKIDTSDYSCLREQFGKQCN